MYKIRKSLLDTEKKSYVKEETIYDIKLNCNEGINPYGFDEKLLEQVDFNYEMWMNYPYHGPLREAVIKYWEKFVNLEKENIIFSQGSMGSLHSICSLFLTENPKVIGFVPQFTEFVTNLLAMGYEYVGVPLKAENNYRMVIEDLISQIDESYSFVYLDNPNNPTGYYLELDDVRRLLEHAKSKKVFVIVDEAYGDFVENSRSSVNLLEEFDNLISVRTMSKGFGLAGARLGYIIANKTIINYLDKLQDPYVVPGPVVKLGTLLLQNEHYIEGTMKKISKFKKSLRNTLGENLKMAETIDECPIALLYHINESVDLAHEFGLRGVSVISGDDFYSLKKNCCRLRVPTEEKMEILLDVVKEIEKI